jgi:Na+/H+ antiporter
MALFESTLLLLLAAIVLLQISRRLAIPYPSMLALAGIVVAVLPRAPNIGIDPHLALALFIAPALLDAAYDLPPRALRRNWAPLLALAAIAVLLTTAAVAWAGVALEGMPLAAAIALGATVAPPDAAAAAAMLDRFELPRRTVTILKGESLLNDATALLIFSAAVSVTAAESLRHIVPEVALAVPGGIVLGVLIGRVYLVLAARLAGTLGGTLFQFVAAFGTWIIAYRLEVSAILTVVAFAMTVARYVPERQSPRDRVDSYSIWEIVVFLLNVLAFLLMGLQAHAIVARLEPGETWRDLGFAGAVLLIVIVVRLVWVLLYGWVARRVCLMRGAPPVPTVAQGLVVSWCGMRGLVTLATALALPQFFPSRDVIVLSALAVVLGTLILQGLTLGPLIRRLGFEPDGSLVNEVASARVALLDAAIASVSECDDEAAKRLRDDLAAERMVAADGRHPRAVMDIDRLRRQAIAAKRGKLAELRRSGEIEDDVFHTLEQELDWAELAASPPDRFEHVEG